METEVKHSEQEVVWADGEYTEFVCRFKERNIHKVFLVCDGAFRFLKIAEYVEHLRQSGTEFVFFREFTPNPRYEEVIAGVDLFRKENCDIILAIGGGSAMDVAKCIKLYATMDENRNYLEQPILTNEITFWAMPTTAGTGSEATRYAVIYYNGEKQSVTHESCIPSVVFLDPSVLQTLPEYQKKATMLDALCHAIESFWSVNSTEESRDYSAQAVHLVMSNYRAYLTNRGLGCRNMLLAANMAGKAINITQTTAGHAMCYKLTSLYGIAHGHAAALCVAVLWPYMLQHIEACIDPRGEAHLKRMFAEIASAMQEETSEDAMRRFLQMLNELEMEIPKMQVSDFDVLKRSVNPVRLKNNPVRLTEEVIDALYHEIIEKRK